MAKSKSTRSRLVQRAAKGTRNATSGRAPAGHPKKPPARSLVKAAAKKAPATQPAPTTGGGLQVAGLDLGGVEETVRTVVNYVQQNPLAAAAVALGAGVALTSMYWDQRETRGSGRRSG